MSLPADWDPRAPPVLDDQIAAYDAMRRRCPVAHSDYLHWSLFRHADVLRVLTGSFVLTLLATLYPSWRASRLQPAEALRHE